MHAHKLVEERGKYGIICNPFGMFASEGLK
jgi:hypothetical protein